MKQFVIAFGLFVGQLGFAQVAKHTAQQGEGIYGIAKKYNVSQESIINANPFLKERGLKLGDVLVIPGVKAEVVNKSPEIASVYGSSDKQTLEVLPGETLESVAKKAGISKAALLSLNPQLNGGVKAGDVVLVPLKGQVPKGKHLVKSGESMMEIAKMYNASLDDLYAANPSLQTHGLVEGIYINVPSIDFQADIKKDGFIHHKVTATETLFGLASAYKVSVDTILANNNLSEGLKAGQTIKIPLQQGAKVIGVEPIVRQKDDQIHLLFLMPFGIGDPSMDAERALSKDFYYGSKLALKKLAAQGKNITATVVDTKNDTESLSAFLSTYDMSDVDVVIGPFFKSGILTTAQALNQSDIAIVSPFSSNEELTHYKNVIIASAQDQDLADRVIAEISTTYKGQEFYVIQSPKDVELGEYTTGQLEKKFPRAKINVIQDPVSINPLEGQTAKEIITVLATDDAVLAKKYIDRLKTLDVVKTEAYAIGYVPLYDELVQDLKNLGFVYSLNRKVNEYGAEERQILGEFVRDYCTKSPSKYAQIGYDVTYDLVDRMNKSGDLANNLVGAKTRLSSKFDYQRSPNGALLNKGVRLVKLFSVEQPKP